MKSPSRAGPRRPLLSEFWLSPTFTPWLVVSSRPPESTRTRLSDAAAGLKPCGGAPEPAFGEALCSVSVLELTAGSVDCALAPVAAESENSDVFAALNGNCPATPSTALSFCATAAAAASSEGCALAPPTVGAPDSELRPLSSVLDMARRAGERCDRERLRLAIGRPPLRAHDTSPRSTAALSGGS